MAVKLPVRSKDHAELVDVLVRARKVLKRLLTSVNIQDLKEARLVIEAIDEQVLKL